MAINLRKLQSKEDGFSTSGRLEEKEKWYGSWSKYNALLHWIRGGVRK